MATQRVRSKTPKSGDASDPEVAGEAQTQGVQLIVQLGVSNQGGRSVTPMQLLASPTLAEVSSSVPETAEGPGGL